MIQYDNVDTIKYNQIFKGKVKRKKRKLRKKKSCQHLSSDLCRVECVKARTSGCTVFSCSKRKKFQCLGWGRNNSQTVG